MAGTKRAAILVPGGKVFHRDGVDTLEGTNTDGRCNAALKLEQELRAEGYHIVDFFSSGTADHPYQVVPTSVLITERLRSKGANRIVHTSEDDAWDTGGNVRVFRELLRQYGWWPRYDRPQSNTVIYVVSEEIHTKRIQVLFFLRHGVRIHRYPDGEKLDPNQQKLQRFYLLLTYFPPAWSVMSWYAKHTRQTARSHALQTAS